MSCPRRRSELRFQCSERRFWFSKSRHPLSGNQFRHVQRTDVDSLRTRLHSLRTNIDFSGTNFDFFRTNVGSFINPASKYLTETGGSPPISRVLSNAPKGIGQSFILASHYCGAPAAYPEAARATHCFPIWPCSGWGLPCQSCYQSCGGRLLHHFTLA